MLRPLLLVLLAGPAAAAPLGQVPVQGYATDLTGAPLAGAVAAEARLVDAAGAVLFTEAQTVVIDEGAFTLYLGAAADLDLALFRDHPGLSLALTLDGDALDPVPLAHTPLAAFAEHADQANHAGSADFADAAGDAETLGGLGPDAFLPMGWAPAWSEITDRPPGLDDGDDDTTYAAGAGLLLQGDTFAVDPTFVADVCYDTEAELHAALDGRYLPFGWTPNLADVGGVDPGLLDGDQDTTYAAGDGLLLVDTTFAVDPDRIQALATDVCYDTVEELTTALEDLFLPVGWLPDLGDLPGLDPSLLDGDQDTTYDAGDGLQLVGTTFSLDAGAVTALAVALCYDNVTELRQSLDPVYLPIGWRPDWTDLQGVPPGLLDGDADTTYAAGDGLLLAGTTFSLDPAAVTAACYDTEAELWAALDDDYLPVSYVPSWLDLSDVPPDLADGDDDTTYTAGDGLTLSPTNQFDLDEARVGEIALDAVEGSGAYVTQPPGTDPLLPHKVRITGACSGQPMLYLAPDGVTDTLDPTGLAAGQLRRSVNDRFILRAGSPGVDATLYLDMTGVPSLSCTLLHLEDDAPRKVYYATDGGNGYTTVWGDTRATFVLRTETLEGNPVASCAQYEVLCF